MSAFVGAPSCRNPHMSRTIKEALMYIHIYMYMRVVFFSWRMELLFGVRIG